MWTQTFAGLASAAKMRRYLGFIFQNQLIHVWGYLIDCTIRGHIASYSMELPWAWTIGEPAAAHRIQHFYWKTIFLILEATWMILSQARPNQRFRKYHPWVEPDAMLNGPWAVWNSSIRVSFMVSPYGPRRATQLASWVPIWQFGTAFAHGS